MKKFLKYSICSVFLLFCVHTVTHGQMVPASIVQTSTSVTGTPRQTGNDYLDDGTNKIEFSVWDLTNGASRFAWNVNGTSSGGYLGGGNAVDPDVALIEDSNGAIFVLVFYYDASNYSFKLEVRNWTGSTWSSYTGSPFTISFDYYTTGLNIDADDDGHFVIVWDDHYNQVQGMAGYFDSMSTLQFSILNITTIASNGSFPDVCLYGNGSDRITYTYLSNGHLYVDSDDFSTLLSGSNSSVSQLLNVSPSTVPGGSGTFYDPRIACPNANTGSSDEWTVVVLETDNTSKWDIQSYNYYNGSSNGPTVVNDGTNTYNGNINLTSYENYTPVVSYDNQSPYGINIGWIYYADGMGPGSAVAHFPIVVTCDATATPVWIQYVDYLEVPYGITTSDDDDALSLSGRNGNDLLFMTYSEVAANKVCWKSQSPINGATNLRSDLTWNDLFSNNDIKAYDQIKVYNTLGVQIIDRDFNATAIELNNVKNELMNYNSGLYIIQLINENRVERTIKVINQQQ
ncbi:MAG TPA: T9SS type A sorting domain-containing protein [Bacteroidia bacterium]|nr:T9SS type A sorting domain-containing protein [Bacteroidia bacterium]